jgi:hypothetical protein
VRCTRCHVDVDVDVGVDHDSCYYERTAAMAETPTRSQRGNIGRLI